jgi:hypothetical protein
MADTGDRFDLIELTPLESAVRVPRLAPTPSPAPSPAPTPLESARALLTSATDERALDGAVAALCVQYPSKDHAIRAAMRPVYRAMTVVLAWFRLWGSLARAVSERPGLVAPLQPSAVFASVVPHTGEYRKHNGEWCGWIPHTGRAVRPGDRVVLVRRTGAQATYSVTHLLSSTHHGGSLVEFGDDVTAAPVAALATARQAIPVVHEAPASVASPAPSSGTFLEALTAASFEGATNATTQASGSLASGTMAGVGFTTAQGYVQALANGVKRATADSYLATLASRYSYTSSALAALTVTIIDESNTLPEGLGIVHEASGPSIFEQRRAERLVAAQHVRATADAATVAFAQRLTTSASDEGAWWEIGWDGHGSITRGEILAVCGIAPEPKALETQLGRTCDSLKGTHDCSLVTPPAGIKRRWQIGRGRQHAAFIGAEYGRVLAIVDMLPDGSLRWEGDSAICEEVRTKYDELCTAEVFRAGDVTAWLSQQLRYRFGARKQAHNFLVPPDRREAARELCAKLASVWARGSWVYGRLDPATGEAEIGKYVTNVADILGGLLVSCGAEVTAAEDAWRVTVDAAASKASKVGARAAASALLRHDGERPGEGLRARVDSLVAIVGEGPLAPLRARVAALRSMILAAVDAAGDSTSTRAAMLELD